MSNEKIVLSLHKNFDFPSIYMIDFLIMVKNLSDVFLELVCKSYVEYFCIFVYK